MTEIEHRGTAVGSRIVAGLLLAMLVGACASVIVGFDDLSHSARAFATIIAFVAFGALFLPAYRSALTLRRVVLVGVVLVVIAVVTPPRGSHDIWSYAMYGRLLSVHHLSPFTHVPADATRDPLLHLVARGWRHTGSVYGPGFVAIAAAGTALTGPSELATRLFFQLLEVAALTVALLIIWRRTRDPAAVGFVALNPAVILVVNGGHNDLVVGVTLLAGAILLVDDHPRTAGLVLAAGALTKLVLVLPLGALLLWTARRRSLRSALEAGTVAGVTIIAAYLLSGGRAALGPLVHAGKQHSRASLWQIVTRWLVPLLSVPRAGLFEVEGTAALLLVGTVTVVIVLRMTRRSVSAPAVVTGALAAGAATLVFLLGGAYILPWYSAWGLPVLALTWRSRVALLATLQAAIIGVAYAAPVAFHPIFGTYAQDVVPTVLAGMLTYLVWSAWHGRLALPVGRRTATGQPVAGISLAREVAR